MTADPSLFARLLAEDEHSAPAYRRITQAIATAVTTGRLAGGDRLPTHRELARELGVSVPTVSRGYREAEQQGLISSTVGRGTFVTGVSGIPQLREAPGGAQDAGPRQLDMAVNAPARGIHDDLLRRALTSIASTAAPDGLLGYEPDIGTYEQRLAACAWLARGGLEAGPGQVAICHGGQHALLVAFAAALRPGETLLTEALTYPGAKSAAQMLGLGLQAVAMDGHGLVPEALDAACGPAEGPRALYCMPTAHNPTAITLSPERRQAIVEVARRRDLLIIEDDVFGLLEGDAAPTPLAALAPERTLYLTSLSKTLAPGLRGGVLAGPPSMADRIGALIRASVFNPSPLANAVVLRWLTDGTADRLLDWQREEMARRREAAEQLLRPHPAVARVRSAALHAWVEPHEPWSASEVVTLAEGLGIAISPTPYFSATEQTVPRGVRLCLGNAADVGALTSALRTLADGLERGRPTWASTTRV
ncbi:PLP-dependent aminotransferase family protein [Streptomyces boncukensis]|uniref:PLP-dependent aminotransferase family protein n=1 Tax=Streptomyces boncukensis TaxID=2711219 RepID=A0A6G4WUX5_9ACTN|nr:PLP-dependent aminotransferase family protein [Streptomyces boncukensis]NGO68344.1 PLP-dependent aminotransferase family protein [Streptomyces boncukensis]